MSLTLFLRESLGYLLKQVEGGWNEEGTCPEVTLRDKQPGMGKKRELSRDEYKSKALYSHPWLHPSLHPLAPPLAPPLTSSPL